MTLIHTAGLYHSYGLQPLPAEWPLKKPLGQWAEWQDRLRPIEEIETRFREHPSAVAMGVLTGGASGSLEVIDVDCKYDLTGNLYTELWHLISDNLPDLAPLLPVVQTKSGGYHFYYRCEVIEGSKKLARRPATAEEREKNPNEKALVLIETRGTGGFIITPPTSGYVLKQGSLSDIPTITPEQRGQLLQICRSLNEEPEPDRQPRQPGSPAKTTGGDLSPWDDFNQRGNVVELLEQHGWSLVFRQGERSHMKRPGQSTAKTSGNFHEGLRKLIVHSSSTEFDPAPAAHSPFDVFKTLRGITNNGEAAKELRLMGFGSASTYEAPRQTKASTIRVEATDNNGESTNLNTDGVVNEGAVKDKVIDAVYVYFTDASDPSEIINTAKLLQRSNPAKVFVAKVVDLSDTSTPVEVLRPYEYSALVIIQRYADGLQNGAVSIEEEESLIREFVTDGVDLSDPLDRDRHRQLFMNFVEANDLNISHEALDEALEKLRFDNQREKQRQHFEYLVRDAGELEKKGEVGEALALLVNRGRELRTVAKQDLFSQLITPVREADIAARLSKKIEDINTGYTIAGRPLRLPVGAITVVAAPTSHGKTTMLGNLALRAVEELPDKKVYLLSYEEDADAVTVSVLSTYIGEEIGSDGNRRAIRSYLRGYQNDIRSDRQALFDQRRNQFFDELITPGRLSIQYVDYDSDTLCDALRWLAKQGNAGVVLIDYIQLLHKGGEGKARYANRQLELQQICLDLKDVAVDTGLSIVLAAQFNREVVNPARMHCNKIREAADIEHIANLILGMWNNEKKMFAGADEADHLRDYDGGPGQICVEVLKHRGGVSDIRQMLPYNGSTGLISNHTTTITGQNGNPNKRQYNN